MRIEVDSAQGDCVTNQQTNQVYDLKDNRRKYVDAEKARSSTMTNPDADERMQLSLVESSVVSSKIQSKSHVEGEEVGGVQNCYARTQNSEEEDSDSTTSRSTFDELASDMQNLRLIAGGVDQCIELLVSRGPPGGTSTAAGRDTDTRQSSMRFVWPTSVDTVPNDVRCKRKSTACEFPEINFQPQSLRAADDTSSEVFQLGTDCRVWTEWGGALPQKHHATKFRRTGNDPQESDERVARVCDDLVSASTVASEVLDGGLNLGEFGLLFDSGAECDLAKYLCPDIVPVSFAHMNRLADMPPRMQTRSDSLGVTDELSLSQGTLLDQLKEIRPPPTPATSWYVADPDRGITLQQRRGDQNPAMESNMPVVTTTVIGGDTITYPSTRTLYADLISNCSSSVKPDDSCVFPCCSDVLLSTRPAFPAPSPSVDSGCVASPGSSTERLSFVVSHHNLPPDFIFDYVEDKLRELVRTLYFLRRVLFIVSL